MNMRRKPGDYPNIRFDEIIVGGTLFLWRNPADKPFGEQDAWTLTTTWEMPDDIPAAYDKLLDQEKDLAAQHPFAWDSDFGYLSPNPHHCGTGLCVEGEFHLEALHLIGDLPPVLQAFEAIRFTSSSIVEDGIRQAAHIFRVRNSATLGISEQNLVKRATRLFEDLALQEYNARKSLVEENPRILEDAIARSLALLRSARLLAPGEYLDMLSPIRLAASMGFLDGITRSETVKIMRDQLNAPELPVQTDADNRKRDARDARLSDRANARFASVELSKLAKEYFS